MKTYHDGPIPYEKRERTDTCCLVIFAALVTFLMVVAIYAWALNGNFSKLTTAYDSDGNGCGVTFPTYPYLYFASPHATSLWVTVCVSQCPVATDTVLQCHPNSVVTSCSPNNSANNSQAVQIYNTTLLANTVCVPTSSVLMATIAPATSGYATKLAALATGWKLILISIPIAIGMAIVVMILIRLTARCFVYALIFLLVGVLIAFGIYVWTVPVGSTFGSTALFQNNFARTAVSLLSFFLAFAVCLFICCYHSRLTLASKIVEVSASFVAKNCYVVFIPLMMFGLTLVVLTVWILQALGYYSLGTAVTCTQCYPFQHFNLPNSVYILLVVHVFYLLWLMFFMIHTSQFLITGTASSWYFNRDSPYCQTSHRYVGKHMGSVCVGSFLVALVGFIKLIYTLLAPDPDKQHTGAVYYFRKCCDCVCWLCIGKLFDWLNAGAYTWINMAGDSYCSSAIDALSLRLKNFASTGVLYILGIVFAVVVRGGITALTVFSVYLMIQNVGTYSTTIQDSSLLLTVVGFLAFAVSCFFMGVYSDSMQSLYMTYLMDIDAGMDRGNCPDELKDFIEAAQKDQHMEPAK